VTTGVSVDGRVLARNGAVTLDTDTITTSSCTSPPVATTPTKTTPTATTPTRTTPASTTPGSTTPGKTAPGKTAPSKTTPGSTAPSKTTPGSTAPSKTTPGSTAPGKTTPGKTTPGSTKPGSTPVPGGPATPDVSPTQDLVSLVASHVAYLRPDASSPSLGVVQATTPITEAPCVLPVIGTYKEWLEVRLPGRPNGRTGWIKRSGTTRSVTSWHLVVDTARRVVTAYHWGRATRSFSAVVGTASTSTPTGEFYVEETIAVGSSDVGGPFALALSARSTALKTYAGGPGQIAVHGLSNIGGVLGTATSRGCVRLDDSAMRWLVARVGAGTPITIIGRD
jgi:L,D-transpeptidase catalytic domain